MAMTWFCGVTISRLYLGVHSVPDMAAGAVSGVLILVIYLCVDDYIDNQCTAGQYVVPKALLLANILLYIHPRTNPETNSYGESVILTGSTFGVVASRVITFREQGRYSLLQSLSSFDELPWQTLIFRSLLRLVIGTSMIVGGRIILKPILRELWRRIYAWLEFPVYSYKEYSRQYPPTTKHYTNAYRLPPLSTNAISSHSSFDGESDDDEVGHDKITPIRNLNMKPNRSTQSSDVEPYSISGTSNRSGLKRHTRFAHGGINAKKSDDSKDDDATDQETEDDPVDTLPYDVDIPSRFMAYSLLGWILGEGAPAVFDLLDI